MTWIVAANSNVCRIYTTDVRTHTVTLIKEINHPEIRMKKSEYLTSDRPGHYSADGTTGGSYAPHSDPKEVEIDRFAREIAELLNHERNEKSYKQLIMVTSVHMQGLLLKHLDKHVEALVIKKIPKDVMNLAPHEMMQFIQENS